MSGFRELGLPFESDSAISRHVAAFLQAHGDRERGPIRPTHVLFNGGVFKADVLRERLLEIVGSWFAGGTAFGVDTDGSLTMSVPHSVVAEFTPVPLALHRGVSNGAGVGPESGVAPGSVASIFGEGLAASTAVGPASPLARTLAE